MEMNTRDTIQKKLLDVQENVRDFECFSKEVNEQEVSQAYKEFAEQSAMQAKKLQELLNKHDGK